VAKRGRPPSVNTKAPPGKKWCSKCKTFKWRAEFNGKDHYCEVCRREYNKEYKQRARGYPVTIMNVETDILCKCGNMPLVNIGSSFDSGTWTCNFCNAEFTGSVSVELTYGNTSTVQSVPSGSVHETTTGERTDRTFGSSVQDADEGD